MTPGGKGIPSGDRVTTEKEMAQRRKQEIYNAVTSFGGTPMVFDFPDTKLSELWHNKNQKKLIEAVLATIRKKHFGAIFSFHPSEATPGFDHPDHNITGLIAQLVGDYSNVSHFYPHLPVYQTERPNLFYWTSAMYMANRVLELTEEDRMSRKIYRDTYYQTQFSGDVKEQIIFDRITWEESMNQHVERYFQVR